MLYLITLAPTSVCSLIIAMVIHLWKCIIAYLDIYKLQGSSLVTVALKDLIINHKNVYFTLHFVV